MVALLIFLFLFNFIFKFLFAFLFCSFFFIIFKVFYIKSHGAATPAEDQVDMKDMSTGSSHS